ncbi:Bug family tripartite tricarboxylate transporter substrate binding protein [Falsirhodobacter halotolerans]|uniref:Bug family tripartite tricarboxylate transporter substrate binding protein n=1 Tax=Falsirhodobacter halotolerans TaxID=1146892 RepID=UPI001FD5CCA0|nr:tripartite tricarboxylate transporter substrate binding protein [Falsirhodobacter halotolerans]MCJ8139112.1 tripartite tricarboxylate transporter substrate binding protein [Falsirhodobacter halotolerans]
MNTSRALGAFAALVLSAGSSTAQDYPDRTISMVVAYSAGGGTDIAARTLVPYIDKYLPGDQTIAVINKPGAAGELGFSDIAKAAPDGYTIGFINTPTILTIPIQRDTSFAFEQIKPIANVVFDAGSLVALPDNDFGDLAGLIAAAKKAPGTITYGTTGIGSDDHLSILALEREAGITLRHVPFSGSSEIRAAVLGGHIALGSMNIGEVINSVNEGEIVTFGQMAAQRWEGAPDVPTFREQGIDIVSGAYRGVGAPADLDPAIIDILSEAVGRAVADEDFRAAAAKQALPLDYQASDEFTATLIELQGLYQTLWDENPWVD